MQNRSYENEFDLAENKPVGETHAPKRGGGGVAFSPEHFLHP